MKMPLLNKIVLLIVLYLSTSGIAMSQYVFDTTQANSIGKPSFFINMERYREAVEEHLRIEKEGDQIPRSYIYKDYCPLLFEIKNQSNNNIFCPLLRIETSKGYYNGIYTKIIKPGASVFIFAEMPGPICTENLSPRTCATLTYRQFKEYGNMRPRAGRQYGFNWEFGFERHKYKSAIINKKNSCIINEDTVIADYDYYNHIPGAHGMFNFFGSLKNSQLFAIDTFVNVKDTFSLKEKYDFYKVINDFYILVDTINKNDLLANFFSDKWNPKIIPSDKIEVQNEKFYYKELINDFRNLYRDSVENGQKKIIATIKITNHSEDYLYVKKQIAIPTGIGYTLHYFGQEKKKENETIKALAPGADLIVTIIADYERVNKLKYIDLILNTLFINCPNTKHRINFTPGYFIDPKTK